MGEPQALEMLDTKRDKNPAKKDGNIGLRVWGGNSCPPDFIDASRTALLLVWD
jgi:hypothetical protein